ncbi:sulfatase-like hydrolase/transferase [Tessaracoccus sp. MC1756]|uniref:sulfatase-like hydrolase/transferase n=1 Tax=Tessaracoccus sp. MC1756 TaxID=2760311 RepID=UPI00160427C9|nr:sulfatase-like hydrolase/transferase [Tessaracoccus sp. MC1756]MBB1510462.1 sulfatase-like hydrolase/transferase [Tessaracoccus sp. MC1756]
MNRTSRPHVLVILADDLGWGDLGCFGATRVRTPNIDALAARGTSYWDAHAASSVCTPSRYGLLTGRHPWRSPLKAGVLGGADPCIIADDVPTIASVLQAEGYRTGAFGKWHLGLDWQRTDGSRPAAFDPGFAPDMQGDGRDIDYTVAFHNGPLEHGFERYFGIAGSLDMPPYCFLDQNRTVGIPTLEKQPLITSQRPGLMVPGWEDDQVDVAVTRAAQEWLKEPDERPFFAYVAAASPHRPCVPPGFVRGTSDAGARGDSIHLFDWMVGELLGVLPDDVLAQTLVIVTSDNGAPMIFPEDGDVVIHRPNGAWRGQKADAYEAGHRVPLVITGPGFDVGAESRALVSLLDLLPTISRCAGVAATPPADGVALGDRTEQDLVGAQAYDGRLLLRSASAKVIYGSGSGGFSEPVGQPCGPGSELVQVFDLAADPAEARDIRRNDESVAPTMYEEFVAATGYAPVPDP